MPQNLGTYVNNYDVPRKKDVDGIDSSKSFKRPMRVMLISDTHYQGEVRYNLDLSTSTGYWYNRTGQERMDEIVKWVNEEHQKAPVDCVLHLGDVCYLNEYDSSRDEDYVNKWFKEYARRFPCPVYAVPGNHDGYYADEWLKATGIPRQYTVELNDVVFVFLDTFKCAPDVIYNGQPVDYKQYAAKKIPGQEKQIYIYTPADVQYIQDVLDKTGDKKLILCSHYFKTVEDGETQEFVNLVQNEDRILCLLQGHVHKFATRDYENTGKTLVTASHIAFAMNSGSIVKEFESTYCPWNYALLEVTEDGNLTVQNIRPAETYYQNSNTTSPPINVTRIEYEPITIVTGELDYAPTTDRRVWQDSLNNYAHYTATLREQCLTTIDGAILPYGANLNSITTPGTYKSNNTDKTATLSHVPSNQSGGFKMVVENNTQTLATSVSGTYITQSIYPGSDNPVFCFQRHRSASGSWSNWQDIKATSRKLLWSGTAEAGDTITLDSDYKYYTIFIVTMSGQGTYIPVIWIGSDHFRGVGGYCLETHESVIYTLTGKFNSSGKLEIITCMSYQVTPNTSTVGHLTMRKISNIYGLV